MVNFRGTEYRHFTGREKRQDVVSTILTQKEKLTVPVSSFSGEALRVVVLGRG
jgi:hypothetical protein